MSNTTGDLHRTVNARIGTSLLILAGVLSILIFLDRATSIAVPFPGIWYRSRGLHLLLCITLYILSWLTLRTASEPADDKPATGITPAFHTIRLFTKQNCELCDRAAEVLTRFRNWLPEIEVIDIEGHPELEREFGECVPVIEIDSEVRFRGAVNEVLLQRMIEAKAAQLLQQTGSQEHTA